MKSIRNNIQLIGHLGRDPEVRDLDNGNKIAKISIATKDIYKNRDGEKVVETQWHNIVAWGKIAENIGVFLKKGNEVALKGKLTHRAYDDKNGIRKYISEIVANEFMLLGQAAKSTDA